MFNNRFETREYRIGELKDRTIKNLKHGGKKRKDRTKYKRYMKLSEKYYIKYK